MQNHEFSRREALKKSAVATLGALIQYSLTVIAKKQISPSELLAAVCRRVEAMNPKLNALCHLFFDKAEAQINGQSG